MYPVRPACHFSVAKQSSTIFPLSVLALALTPMPFTAEGMRRTSHATLHSRLAAPMPRTAESTGPWPGDSILTTTASGSRCSCSSSRPGTPSTTRHKPAGMASIMKSAISRGHAGATAWTCEAAARDGVKRAGGVNDDNARTCVRNGGDRCGCQWREPVCGRGPCTAGQEAVVVGYVQVASSVELNSDVRQQKQKQNTREGTSQQQQQQHGIY